MSAYPYMVAGDDAGSLGKVPCYGQMLDMIPPLKNYSPLREESIMNSLMKCFPLWSWTSGVS